jgi:hypothetical protein
MSTNTCMLMLPVSAIIKCLIDWMLVLKINKFSCICQMRTRGL